MISPERARDVWARGTFRLPRSGRIVLAGGREVQLQALVVGWGLGPAWGAGGVASLRVSPARGRGVSVVVSNVVYVGVYF